ncbi:hypothetical protein H0A36_29280 [Endozoicomonas sp. SM1973]|uniref:Uncharacterized protein n=1 Tax=Spartinivicinus marinus TaxID=2994442 RepID=A0A853IAY3_9GAMM|nr:hypothetical protein [Spartinivicinus marinus]MCX4025648.1 hypothetical protein [Spartinivicinus marinus]NYZ70109.1 hypothetical protein [Spartinivicinus marinus]
MDGMDSIYFIGILLALFPFIFALFLTGKINKVTNYLAVLGIFYLVSATQSLLYFVIPRKFITEVYSSTYGAYISLLLFYCLSIAVSIFWYKKIRKHDS